MTLKNFDFLSPNITLYYNNKKRHSSWIGGILTIIMFFLFIYIIVQYSLIKVYPNQSSLSIYRNYENEIEIYFNKSGLFHYIWIYNQNILNNNIDQNLIQLNNLKRGIIRIYMTYTFDKYEFNSSQLRDIDHWVYDTCSSYVDDEDQKYDYSFSSCIKYYYNSKEKKYYSINDNSNFKYPFISQNQNNENNIFATFIEKCTNNSVLNEVLGDCYPEEKIKEYLSIFNNVFLSFINNKFQIKQNNGHVKAYSHKIYDNISYSHRTFFYLHDLTFIPFNYKGSNGILSKKEVYDSFMLDEDKLDKIINSNNNKLLLAYIFHSKKYINEYMQKDKTIIELLHGIGGAIYFIYIIFYTLNYFISQRIELRNFHAFINDKEEDLIHRHINYARSKITSFKSNVFSNLSNDINNRNEYNALKSTYFGNVFKNDTTLNNFNNISNGENNNNNDNINNSTNTPKLNTLNNNYTIKVNKVNKEEKEREKIDNIIVINNNSFMNNNKYISNNSSTIKKNSLKLLPKYNNFPNKKDYHKTYTVYKSENESESFSNVNSVIKREHFDFVKFKPMNIESPGSKRNNSNDQSFKQKIVDTSSVSLLNKNQDQNHLNINYNNNLGRIETPMSRNENSENLNFFSKLNAKFQQDNNKIIPKGKHSSKRLEFNYHLGFLNHIMTKKTIQKNKSPKINKSTILLDNKERRRSGQRKHLFKNEKEKEKEKEENDRYKYLKLKSRKTGINLKSQATKEEKHLSLFSRNSMANNNIISNNNYNKTYEYFSPTPIGKSFVEQSKRTSPVHNERKKMNKHQSFDFETKSFKKSGENSIKNINYSPQKSKLIRIIKNYHLSPKIILKYICLCKTYRNRIYILNEFRNKLLSEEYLYILHINMFIFKKKFGCKSNLKQVYLLEELFNDY